MRPSSVISRGPSLPAGARMQPQLAAPPAVLLYACSSHVPSALLHPAVRRSQLLARPWAPAALQGPHGPCKQQQQHAAWQQLPRQPKVAAGAAAASTSSADLPDNVSGFLGPLAEQYKEFMAWARKFMPMVGLFFLLAFVNTILDSLKDTLVITATGGGAQVIPYLTVYAVLPSSVAFLVAYSYASQHLSRPALFNAIVATFMGFFTLFAFVLYPNHATLHSHGLADSLAQVLPQGVEGLVGMLRNWTFTAFFCMSELWGDVCLGLLFWGLANDTTQMSDAPTLYPLFGLGANVAQALGGSVLKMFSGWSHASGRGDFGSEIQSLMVVVMGFTCAALALHAYINKRHEDARQRRLARRAARTATSHGVSSHAALPSHTAASNGVHAGMNGAAASSNGHASSSDSSDSSYQNAAHVQPQQQPQPQAPAKKKTKPSVQEIFRVLAGSTPIRCLAIMSLAQGLCTNLMEFAWKSHIGLLYPSPTQFTAFLGDVSVWQGVVTGCLMVLSPAMFSKVGWAGVARATPLLLLWGGALFFTACLVYQFAFAAHAATAVALLSGGCKVTAANHMVSGLGGTVLQGLVFGGALLYVFSKSAKFSLFKPAEEMVYISLDEEGRTKGKAAIDVVGSQAGKSGGSVLQQALLLLSGGALASILPIMACCYFAMAQGWLKSVGVLSAHAKYGHPDTLHESMSSVQTAHLSSCDDDDDAPGSHVPNLPAHLGQAAATHAAPLDTQVSYAGAVDARHVLATQPGASSNNGSSDAGSHRYVASSSSDGGEGLSVGEAADGRELVNVNVTAGVASYPVEQQASSNGLHHTTNSSNGSAGMLHNGVRRQAVNGSGNGRSNGNGSDGQQYNGFATAMHHSKDGGKGGLQG